MDLSLPRLQLSPETTKEVSIYSKMALVYYISSAHPAGLVQSTLNLLVILNELCLLCNHWIVIPTTSTALPTTSSVLQNRTLITAVGYAVCKPIIRSLLLRVPIPPWILFMCLPAQGLLENEIFSSLLQTIDCDDAKAAASDLEGKEESARVPYRQPRSDQIASFTCLLVLTGTVATCDAALALTAKSMALPENRQTHIAGLIAFATVLYLGCMAWTNYLLCRRLRRRSLLDLLSRPSCSEFKSVATYITVQQVVTTVPRWALGHGQSVNAAMLTYGDAVELFNEEKYTGLKEYAARIPPWVNPLLQLASMPLTFLGMYLCSTGMGRSREGRSVE